MTRQRVLGGARGLLVLLTIVFAWWGFRGRWGEIADAVAATGSLRVGASVAFVAGGLAVTGLLWRLLLRWVGSDVAPRDAAVVFFTGQLGKYVPGSVWSVAAQAQLGRRHDVPARSSVAASSVFLLVHTATGLLLGGTLLAVTRTDPVPASYAVPAALVGMVALAPPLLRRVADRLSGGTTRLGIVEVGTTVALMSAVWALYGGSLLLLVPGADGGSTGLVSITAAFALAHAVGVLVVVAPAGVGAREGVLVALLAPALGVPGAAAAALLIRVVHALADFAVAGAAAAVAHAGRPRDVAPSRAGG